MIDDQGQGESAESSTASTKLLESAVVDWDAGPARCTIYPPAVPECELTTTWLSADFATFVSLDDAR